MPAHAVLLAVGLGCESYLDTGNRAAFAEPSLGFETKSYTIRINA